MWVGGVTPEIFLESKHVFSVFYRLFAIVCYRFVNLGVHGVTLKRTRLVRSLPAFIGYSMRILSVIRQYIFRVRVPLWETCQNPSYILAHLIGYLPSYVSGCSPRCNPGKFLFATLYAY